MMVVDMEHELVDDELEELSAATKAAKRVTRIEDESIASVRGIQWTLVQTKKRSKKKQVCEQERSSGRTAVGRLFSPNAVVNPWWDCRLLVVACLFRTRSTSYTGRQFMKIHLKRLKSRFKNCIKINLRRVTISPIQLTTCKSDTTKSGDLYTIGTMNRFEGLCVDT